MPVELARHLAMPELQAALPQRWRVVLDLEQSLHGKHLTEMQVSRTLFEEAVKRSPPRLSGTKIGCSTRSSSRHVTDVAGASMKTLYRSTLIASSGIPSIWMNEEPSHGTRQMATAGSFIARLKVNPQMRQTKPRNYLTISWRRSTSQPLSRANRHTSVWGAL